jgi:hypothetical protein
MPHGRQDAARSLAHADVSRDTFWISRARRTLLVPLFARRQCLGEIVPRGDNASTPAMPAEDRHCAKCATSSVEDRGAIRQRERPSRYCIIDRAAPHREQKRKHVTLQMLRDEYIAIKRS